MMISDDVRQLRHRQVALADAAARAKGPRGEGASAIAATFVRLPADATWPPDLGTTEFGRLYRVSPVELEGGYAPGSTLTATVSANVFTAAILGDGTPPDPNLAEDDTARTYILLEQVGGYYCGEYWDGSGTP